MAFDFLDMFPDSQAAVAGSQATRDILENQHKQSMGFMDMENSLMKTVQARKQMDEQLRMDPLAKTVEAVKLLQGLNMTGQSPMQGVDLMDVNSVNEAIKGAANSGQIHTNLEADLMKTKAQAAATAANAQMLEGGRNTRSREDDLQKNRAQAAKELASMAEDHQISGGIKKIARASTPEKKEKAAAQIRQLVAAKIASLEVLDPQTAQRARAEYAEVLGLPQKSATRSARTQQAPMQEPAAPQGFAPQQPARPSYMNHGGGPPASMIPQNPDQGTFEKDGWLWKMKPDGGATAIRKVR